MLSWKLENTWVKVFSLLKFSSKIVEYLKQKIISIYLGSITCLSKRHDNGRGSGNKLL